MVFFLGALTFFVCSVLGAVHAVSVAAAQTENRPVIVLDAGHGGEDGGAVGVNGVEEKTVNLAIALFVREKLEAAGYPVKMIREVDTAVGDTTLSTLNERKRSDILYRTQIVNETENCIFVSIHQNFFEQSQYSGAQMFYSPANADSERFASILQNLFVKNLQPDNMRETKLCGKELASTSYAFGTLLRMGVHLSYGTDCPVEDCNPFPNIYMAVTRKDRQGRPAGGFYPGECVDVETAIDAYTKESAYAEFQEDVKGRLKPGYYADMVLLDRDIFTVDPMEIKDILPVMTVVGGKVVYQR